MGETLRSTHANEFVAHHKTKCAKSAANRPVLIEQRLGQAKHGSEIGQVTLFLSNYLHTYIIIYIPPHKLKQIFCVLYYFCALETSRWQRFTLKEGVWCFLFITAPGSHAVASRRGRRQGGRCVSRYSDLSHSPLIYYPL